jgi:type IV pilus assembly protein PilW
MRARHNPIDVMRQQGLSLIELMVSMAIGLVLVVTVGYAYLGAKQSFRTQNAMSRVQEGARYGFEYLSQDIRMTGFTGGAMDGGTNVVNTAALASSVDPVMLDLFNRPLLGYENGAPPKACTTASTTTCYLRGDSLTVVHANTDSDKSNDQEYALNDHTPPGFTLSAASDLASGDILVAADPTHSAVFQATQVAGTAISYNPASAPSLTPNNTSSALGTFSGSVASRKLFKLYAASYYIGRNPAGEPALYRLRLNQNAGGSTAEELVEGVENMQIEYGVDTSATADNIIDAYVTADVITNNTGAIFGATLTANQRWRRVNNVRITLTLVSRSDAGGVSNSADGLLHRSFSSTIAIRNSLWDPTW